jgi:hypothetical protein
MLEVTAATAAVAAAGPAKLGNQRTVGDFQKGRRARRFELEEGGTAAALAALSWRKAALRPRSSTRSSW